MKCCMGVCAAVLGTVTVFARPAAYEAREGRVVLDSVEGHGGAVAWSMKKASDVKASGEDVSKPDYAADGWMPAVVPGTVLNSLVHNSVYPAPDYGLNNQKTQKNYWT